jgi:hypothetical protein
MWYLAVGVLLLGAVGAEVVWFSNCPVSGKAAWCIQRKGGTGVPTVMRGGPWTHRGPRGYFCLSVASCQDKLLC